MSKFLSKRRCNLEARCSCLACAHRAAIAAAATLAAARAATAAAAAALAAARDGTALAAVLAAALTMADARVVAVLVWTCDSA